MLALTSDDDHDIADFLERKRQWVFNTVREMERVISNRHAVPRFMTGSKILSRPRTIRAADFANGWGSCGAEGNILINWHLVFAPRKVLKYVIAHELTHLRHRSHGPAVWDFLQTIVLGFEASKAWLDANQGSLSSEFLDI